MKFILVSPKRLSVYLSKKELLKEDKEIEDIYSAENINETLESVFDKAYKSIGFDCKNAKLKINFLPMTEGDIFISIVKTEGNKVRYIYSSENFDYIAKSCFLCKDYNLSFNGIYKKDKYFVVFEINNKSCKDAIKILNVFDEFCKREEILLSSLSEHGKKLTGKNTLRTINRYYT